MFGIKLHIMINENEMNIDKIKEIVVDKNIFEIKHISKITPTLEDVFINLVGKK